MTIHADNEVGSAAVVSVSAAAHLAAEQAMPCHCRPTYARHDLVDPDCAHAERDRLAAAIAHAAIAAFVDQVTEEFDDRADRYRRLSVLDPVGRHDAGVSSGYENASKVLRQAAKDL